MASVRTSGDAPGVTDADLAATYGGAATDYTVTSSGAYRKHYTIDLTAQAAQDWTGDTASTPTSKTIDGNTVTAYYTGSPTTHGLTANGLVLGASGTAFQYVEWSLSDLISSFDPDTHRPIVVLRWNVPTWGNTNSYAQAIAVEGSAWVGCRWPKSGASTSNFQSDRNNTRVTLWTVGSLPANGRIQLELMQGATALSGDASSGAVDPDALTHRGFLATGVAPDVFTSSEKLRLAFNNTGGSCDMRWLGFDIYTPLR